MPSQRYGFEGTYEVAVGFLKATSCKNLAIIINSFPSDHFASFVGALNTNKQLRKVRIKFKQPLRFFREEVDHLIYLNTYSDLKIDFSAGSISLYNRAILEMNLFRYKIILPREELKAAPSLAIPIATYQNPLLASVSKSPAAASPKVEAASTCCCPWFY
ncbi:MAG: hypothetical protein K0R66_190 [Gammaproteobacteria bacterium]|jgi:hypothetical protein|nr:hypothetical protein [Gammaproteobacteria bacterium]